MLASAKGAKYKAGAALSAKNKAKLAKLVAIQEANYEAKVAARVAAAVAAVRAWCCRLSWVV